MSDFEEHIRLRLTSNANDFDSIVTDLLKGTIAMIEELENENAMLRDAIERLTERLE